MERYRIVIQLMRQLPVYMGKASTQTLREGLDEYYACNPHITPPETQPPEFAGILRAHDAGHVIYGCDTGMFDELKILPLFWWTSECTFQAYLEMKNSPAVDVMYREMIRERGEIRLYADIILVLPRLIPALLPIWLRTRNRKTLMPFLEFEHLLDRTLFDIRKEYDLLWLFG